MLSRTAEYALRAAVMMARSPELALSADALCDVTKVPRRYLHKVLQDLVRGRLVRSQPGPGGGYSLARQPDDITILDVVSAVAPLERITRCPLGLASHTTLCPLHKKLDQVYALAEDALRKVTLGQLTRSSSPIAPLCEVRVVKSTK